METKANHASLPVAVLISGGGTTLRNLLQVINRDQLPIEIKLVVSSRSDAGGLQYARDAGIPIRIATGREFPAPESFRDAIFQPCRELGVQLVVMGGFLKHVLIPHDFAGRVLNIHPSLIPAFCGQGYYGSHVHQAVLDYGAKVSGCTVHFVDDQYDHGPIVLQRVVPVLDDDTAKSLADRVFAEECIAYPNAIHLFAQGRIKLAGRKVSIKS
ncbi:MAG: phosphoribosylglycinamide formyltransferase [Pirellulaceae bacterium]|nr:phosphoribosylglycinamide formyltransferase [Planctomycetales bacterium]